MKRPLSAAPFRHDRTMLAWLNENGAAVSTLMAIATAIVAVLALRQTARDSADRSRPMVLAEFRRAVNSDRTVDLVIRNAGASMARDVHVTFDPVPVIPDDGGPYVTSVLLRRYERPVSVLTPGQELSNIWWSGREGDGTKLVNAEPTPDTVTIGITYRGDRGKAYSESITLDVETITHTSYATSSTSFPGRMESITKSLAAVEKHLGSIASRK